MDRDASGRRASGTVPLQQAVADSLDQYFALLGNAAPHPLYAMVLSVVEPPLLRYALNRCQGNQSAAAKLLGINRNTLRKKLVEYGILQRESSQRGS